MRALLIASALVAVTTVGAVVAAQTGDGDSDRSHELVRLDCASTVNRRDLTLFANGTVRLRVGKPGEERMALAEMGPAEVETYVELLSAVDLSEAESPQGGAEGDWVDRCTLTLDLPGRPRLERRFQRFDSLPLALARILDIVGSIADRVPDPLADSRLPVGYEPEPGDVLRQADGSLFEVIDFTSDGQGVELQGVTQPLTVFILRDRLGEQFVALERRRRE